MGLPRLSRQRWVINPVLQHQWLVQHWQQPVGSHIIWKSRPTVKQYLNILHTAFCTVVSLFCLKMNSPSLNLVVCSPVIPLRLVALRLSHHHVVALVSFLISLFLFFFFPKRAKCNSVSWVASRCTQYWHNHFTKHLFVTVAQYRSLVYCSIITLYAAASHRTFLGEIKKWNCKTFMWWSKKNRVFWSPSCPQLNQCHSEDSCNIGE